MRVYSKLPAGFNERIEGFAPEFMAIFLSILIIIFYPLSTLDRLFIVFFTFYLFTSFGSFFFKGQSFGKKWAKTEVLRLDNRVPHWAIIHLRDLTKWGLGFLTLGLYFVIAFILFTNRLDRRAPHDLLFKTHVVIKDDLIT
jgi:uncharacterized RDD family membrane protein YckC